VHAHECIGLVPGEQTDQLVQAPAVIANRRHRGIALVVVLHAIDPRRLDVLFPFSAIDPMAGEGQVLISRRDCDSMTVREFTLSRACR